LSEKIVIAGSGLASVECIKAIRESGYCGELLAISDTNLPPFNPMLVTYYASGKIEYDEMFPYGCGFDFYDKYGVSRLFGSAVTNIDAENRIIGTAGGKEITFSKCAIATGAAPVLPGDFQTIKEHILTLRTADDAEKLKEMLGSDRKRVLVVGASMIGIKAAEALLEAGFHVTLADFAKFMFPLAAHENCSAMVQKILRDKNIRLLFNSPAEKAEKDGDCIRVCFSGGPEAEAFDHIIVCAGTRPNLSFIDTNQIKADKGILVNGYMETSAEGVYAAGDVCQAPGIGGELLVLGLVSNARLQGRTAGQNIAGQRVRCPQAVPHNITHFFDNDFAGIGDINGGDEVYEEVDEKNNRYIRLVFADKKLTGVNLLNIPEVSGILKYRLTKGLLTKDDLNEFADESPAMNRLYEKYPGVEKAFAKMR